MPTPKQAERRKKIEDAAYAVLLNDGYRSASLLSIAQRASVSNETMYRWYGNKPGLFAALVERNAEESKLQLEAALAEGGSTFELLRRFGPVLLAMVTSERAVSLNRAAAADVAESATLGAALAAAGRETIVPLLGQVFAQGAGRGEFAGHDPAEIADVYIRLLIGDLQIRRATGVIAELTPAEIRARADKAVDYLSLLFAPKSKD